MHFDIFAFSELVSYGVSIFLMLSGALLLNKEIKLDIFIKHRFLRILYPFIFYISLFCIIQFALNNFTSFTIIFSHYWYFWLIVGVYLSLPIINKFIQHSSIKEIEYFIIIFILGSIFYQFVLFFNIEQYFYLNLFVGPLGFPILGYYLSIKDFKLNPKTLVVLMFLIFVGVTIIKILAIGGIIPYYLVFDFEATQTKVLGSWLDVSIFRILHVTSLFLLFRYLYELDSSYLKRFLQKKIIKNGILSVSRASYGMYLVESIISIIISPFFIALPTSGTEICLTIVLLTGVIFILSWVVVLVFNRVPGLQKFSGYY